MSPPGVLATGLAGRLVVPVGRDARLSGANVRYPAAAQQAVDTRSSDALKLAALVQAPILVAPEVLVEAEARRTGDSPEAALA